jgi:putative transposase
VYHALNRAIAQATLFREDGDYWAFERVLEQAHERVAVRILAYCIMPNHWHLVLWPRADADLSEFMRWLTLTHTQRWHAHHGTSGSGHLYQGRYKSFPVESDSHFLMVCRYVERNALRARLVSRAEDWRWGSLWRRERAKAADPWLWCRWPVTRPPDWLEIVNQPQTNRELEALRLCLARGRPYGSPMWTKRTARRLGLESSLRPRGRPPKKKGTGVFSGA